MDRFRPRAAAGEFPSRRHRQARHAAGRHDRRLSSLHLFHKTTSKFTGFDVDMAEALGKALGVKVELVQTAWPQLMKDFEADNFDVAMGGVSITLDRQKKGMFSTPIMREGKTPIARCADKDKYETIADIDKAGTRVIVNPGGTNERFAKANIKTPRSRCGPTTSRFSTKSPRATPT